MKIYYSIVSIATNPKLDEKFNIGLLCVTPESVFFRFSEVKFNIVSKLLSANGKKLALSALKGIDLQLNGSESETSDIFTGSPIELSNAISESYISYLNRYNNNLIQFSNPITIDLNIDDSVFKSLFKKYIFAEEVFELVVKPKPKSFTTIRNQFRRSASLYANTNFDVTQDVIKDLVVPVNVDVFGKNGSFVTGQSLDFSKNVQQLQSEISSFLYLTEHALKVDKGSKSFVLGNEPLKQYRINHDLWENVRKATIVEFVPLNEADRIIVYMKEKGVLPVE